MRSLIGFALISALAQAQTVDLGPLNSQEQESARQPLVSQGRRMMKTGIHRPVASLRLAAGTRLRSVGAYGLRAHFQGFDAADGTVVLRSASGAAFEYTGRGPHGDGEFWSETLFSDEVQFDFVPGPSGAKPSWQVPEISHSFGPYGIAGEPAAELRCNLDVNCHAEYSDLAKTVAMIYIEHADGQGSCSGTLVRTKSGSGIPYFITANHCVANEQEARSVESFWNYQTDKCNGKAPNPQNAIRPRPTGAKYIDGSKYEEGDAALIVLNSIPAEARFADVDPRELANGESVLGISHPRGSHKRITFGETSPPYWVYTGFAQQLFYYFNITKGSVHPGSSGSAMFTAKGAVTGIASHMSIFDDWPEQPVDICTQRPLVAGYAKLALAWPKFQKFLDDPAPSTLSFSPAEVALTVRNGVIAGEGRQTLVIHSTAEEAVPVTVTPADLWVRVTNPRGTAKKGTPFITQLEIKPELIANRAGLVRTRLDVASGNNGRAIPVDADVVVIPSSVTLAAKVNSAAPGSDCRYELALNLQERGGIDTTLTSLRINGDDYTGQIANWFGTAQLNANAAAGANLKICGPVNVSAPYELVIGGRDAGSGRSWSIHQLTEIPR